MNNKILYIINCSLKNGTGHLRRFITILNNFSNNEFLLLIKLEPGSKKLLKHFKNELKETKTFFYKKNLLNKINEFKNIETIIFDCKEVSEDIYKYLKQNGIIIIVFDDTSPYTGKYADVLIDANIHHNSSEKNTYYGTKYIIFNHNILNIDRTKRKINKKAKKIFVCFGGSDPGKIVNRVIKISPLLKKYHFFIFTNQNYNKIPENVEIISEHNKISEYILKSDMGIISGGLLLYESLYTGLPVIVINQNADQQNNCRFFLRKGIITEANNSDDIYDEDIIDKIINYDSNYKMRLLNSKKAISYVDGKGIERLKMLVNRLH